MSRAFTKETDGDRPDDLPELPVSPHPNYVTPQGLAQLRARLSQAEQHLAAIDNDAEGARQDRDYTARDIRWLQARIANAILVASEQGKPERVGFGTRVELADAEGQRTHYRIVGEDEADPEHGLISWVSPLARALLGARVGDSVLWKRPAGDLEVEVLKIDF